MCLQYTCSKIKNSIHYSILLSIFAERPLVAIWSQPLVGGLTIVCVLCMFINYCVWDGSAKIQYFRSGLPEIIVEGIWANHRTK